PDSALLARAEHQMLAFEVDGDRRDVDVEIAMPQPVDIWRREPARWLQLLTRVELDGDERVAEVAAFRLVVAVTGAHPRGAFRSAGRPAASPESAAARKKCAGLVGLEVVGKKRERHAATTLRDAGVDDVVDEVERPWLRVWRHELRRRHKVVA